MTRQHNRRLIEALVLERDYTGLAEDVVLRDQAQERSFCGRRAATALLDALFGQSFTGIETNVQMVVAGDENAALAFLFHGRQDGIFLGIPPTQQEVDVPMVLMCQMKGGQIREATLYYNAGTLLRQLGLA